MRIFDIEDLSDLSHAVDAVRRLDGDLSEMSVRHVVLCDSNGGDVGVISFDGAADRWQVNLS